MTTELELVKPPEQISSIIYFGTPEAAVPQLRALHASGFKIPLVVSKSDARRGRGKQTTPSPVKQAALELGLTVTDNIEDVLGIKADLGVVVAYGAMIKDNLLTTLPLVNVHFSLLPLWRGAAPVERSILAGDVYTGVSLMVIEKTLDTGAVYSSFSTQILDNETAVELRARLAEKSCDLLIESLASGLSDPQPQDGEPSHAAKIHKSELRLNFDESAELCNRRVRIGKAWTMFRNKRLVIVRAEPVSESSNGLVGSIAEDLVQTGDGQLRLLTVQPEGKKPMAVSDWLRGAQIKSGEQFDSLTDT